jgi:hypothetical protein
MQIGRLVPPPHPSRIPQVRLVFNILQASCRAKLRQGREKGFREEKAPGDPGLLGLWHILS